MKKLLFVILALLTVMALASCDIDGILGTGTNQGDGSYAEDENQNSEDDGEGTDPEKPNTDPEKPNTDPEKPGNDDNYREGLKYTLNSDNASYSVIGIGTCTDRNIEIPATYDGKSVTSIGDRAFSGCYYLKSITIPDSVTSIGASAFGGCSSLTSVTIPNSVTSIGAGAFGGCSGLASVTIPDSVTSIGDDAFYGCESLTTVYYAGTEAEWAKIIIGLDNSNLTSDTRYYYSETEPTTDGNYWRYDENGKVVIWPKAFSEGLKYTLNNYNASVTGIGTCTDKDIKIPPTYNGKPVTSIGNRAFQSCSGLTSVTIGNSVTSIGDDAFSGCTSLASVTISNSVLTVGDNAFDGCLSLTSITIPDSVLSIGDDAFRDCTSLASVTIGNSVTSIGDWVFYGCRGLTSISIPDSVTSIGVGAFCDCTSLASVTIGNSVTSIGSSAFYRCTSLTTVYYAGTKTEWSKISISSDNSKLTSATRYYYSETEPTAVGNYWHYDGNGKVVVW